MDSGRRDNLPRPRWSGSCDPGIVAAPFGARGLLAGVLAVEGANVRVVWILGKVGL